MQHEELDVSQHHKATTQLLQQTSLILIIIFLVKEVRNIDILSGLKRIMLQQAQHLQDLLSLIAQALLLPPPQQL